MTAWKLPTSLTIGGVGYAIRTDFRDVLNILRIYSSPEYEEDEKMICCLIILFPEWESIPPELHAEAAEQASQFLDAGIRGDNRPKPTTMDWGHDAPIIIPAVNRVLGQDVRSVEYLHWWTFVGAYMEIGRSLFSSVLSIRQKRAKGKKLDKEEREFLRENQALILLPGQGKAERTPEEKAALYEALGKSRLRR